MKKLIRTAFTITGALTVLHGINKLLSYIADKTAQLPANGAPDKYYEWEYGNIHYIKTGTGKPLLLIHGMYTGASYAEWNSSISALSRHYTVYAIDLLGFGKSQKPNITYSAYLYTTLINDFISDIIKEPAFVAANAESASIALAAHRLDSERVTGRRRTISKLLLISPVSTIKMTDKHIKALLSTPIISTTLYNIMSSRLFLAVTSKKYGGGHISERSLNARLGGLNAKKPIFALMTNFISLDIGTLITHASVPIHIIWGENNVQNPVSNFRNLEEHNINLTLAVFQDTGLLPHDENVRAFYKECKWFFN